MILDAGTSDQEQVLFRSKFMKSAFSPDEWRVSENQILNIQCGFCKSDALTVTLPCVRVFKKSSYVNYKWSKKKVKKMKETANV